MVVVLDCLIVEEDHGLGVNAIADTESWVSLKVVKIQSANFPLIDPLFLVDSLLRFNRNSWRSLDLPWKNKRYNMPNSVQVAWGPVFF